MKNFYDITRLSLLLYFSDLREKYRVNVVPKLVVVNTDDGEPISCMARKEIQDKGVAAYRLVE